MLAMYLFLLFGLVGMSLVAVAICVMIADSRKKDVPSWLFYVVNIALWIVWGLAWYLLVYKGGVV